MKRNIFKRPLVSILGVITIGVVLSLGIAGCKTDSDDDTPPTATYLNAKEWKATENMPDQSITSITLQFSGTNVVKQTMYAGASEAGTVNCTYTLSGLTITLTVTSTTMSGNGAPSVGDTYTARFNASEATTITVSGMNMVFTRQ